MQIPVRAGGEDRGFLTMRRSSPIEANGRHGEGIALRSTHFGSAQNVLQVISAGRVRDGNVMPMIIIVAIDSGDSPHDPPAYFVVVARFGACESSTGRDHHRIHLERRICLSINCRRFFHNKSIKESIFSEDSGKSKHLF